MKKELRKRFINERNNLDMQYREYASKKIIETVEKLESYKKANKIFVYVNFGSEIETIRFIESSLRQGKEVYVPKIVLKNMELVKITKTSELKPGHFGVLEPEGSDFYEGEVDLVITPSVAFAIDGYRIGYGKGYYDKYFSKNKYKTSVGLSYEKLLQESVPHFDYDVAVDMMVTEERILVTHAER